MVENLDKHEAILEDLRMESEALRLLIAAYETYLATKRGASTQPDLFPAHTTRNGQSAAAGGTPLTLYEGSERILREVGKPLHVSVLVRKLAELGKKTTGNSLTGALAQDTKKRFRRTAPATFGLAEWPEKGVKP